MADVTIKYNSQTIGEMNDSGVAKLLTSGKKCIGDIEIDYIKSGGDTSSVRGFIALEKDSSGNITKGAVVNSGYIGHGLVLPAPELSHMTQLECDNLYGIALGGLAGLTALTSFTIPANCVGISDKAFSGDISLASVTFRGTPSSISNLAFQGLTALADIYVPWASGTVDGAPWGATNATIHYGEAAGVEITDTWEQIISATHDGTYATKYHLHDYKTIDMGAEGIITYEIVGIDKDVKENGDVVPLTFLAKQALATTHRMNPKYSAGISGTGCLGGYPASEMKTYLDTTIKALLPEVVLNNLTPVVKHSIGFTASGEVFTEMSSVETIWIPSTREIFGIYESTGPVYSPSTRIRYKGNDPIFWWLRSGFFDGKDGANGFRRVNDFGDDTVDLASNAIGVVPGFCLG